MIDDLFMKCTTITTWHCIQQMSEIIVLYHFARSNMYAQSLGTTLFSKISLIDIYHYRNSVQPLGDGYSIQY